MSNRMLLHSDRVDELISQMWKSGYLTINRKYGKYLPSPKPIGEFDVDAVAKYKRKYMIGILVSEDDLSNQNFFRKIKYLSSRNTKYTNEKVTLLIGISKNNYERLKSFVAQLPEENKKQIQIYTINN